MMFSEVLLRHCLEGAEKNEWLYNQTDLPGTIISLINKNGHFLIYSWNNQLRGGRFLPMNGNQ
jgi:hypothetical protein